MYKTRREPTKINNGNYFRLQLVIFRHARKLLIHHVPADLCRIDVLRQLTCEPFDTGWGRLESCSPLRGMGGCRTGHPAETKHPVK